MWLNVIEENPIWFFDATGSIHRTINRQQKPFFYSIVCHDTKKKKILPIAEFLTTSNNQYTISRYLSEIKLRLNVSQKKNVCPQIIVTDMSWALINSIMQVFNHCSVLEYLNCCYDCILKNIQFEKIVYYTCSTHFIKNIIRKAKGNLKGNKTKHFLRILISLSF